MGLIELIVNLIALPIYIVVFFFLVIMGTVIFSLKFFYLGPFAPIIGFPSGLSWAVGCFTLNKKHRK
jgi:multisubunit Na+/H+ antiporter MnhB subunit